jgi:hypothetical protein
MSPHAASRGTFDELADPTPPPTSVDDGDGDEADVEAKVETEAEAKPIAMSCPGGINAEFLDGR